MSVRSIRRGSQDTSGGSSHQDGQGHQLGTETDSHINSRNIFTRTDNNIAVLGIMQHYCDHLVTGSNV